MAELTEAQQLEAEKLKNEALAAELEAAKSVVTDTPSVEEVPTITDAVFKNGKDEYQIVCAAFTHAGIKYAAADAIKNKALMIELIELQAGFLKKL